MGSGELFRSCRAGPSAEREGQGPADNVSWKLGEASGAAGACMDGRDWEVPFGQNSTREWETEAKATPGSGSFPVGSVRTLQGPHRAGQSRVLLLLFSSLQCLRAPTQSCPSNPGTALSLWELSQAVKSEQGRCGHPDSNKQRAWSGGRVWAGKPSSRVHSA